MNYLNAILLCKISKIPISISEIRAIKKHHKEIEPFLKAIIELNKGDIIYNRSVLTNYYLQENGCLENISHGLVASRKIGKPITLTEAIEQDKKGINILEETKKTNLT